MILERLINNHQWLSQDVSPRPSLPRNEDNARQGTYDHPSLLPLMAYHGGNYVTDA